MRVKSFLPAVLLIVSLALPVLSKSAGFEVREYDGMPSMWQNGLPYFGRFADTDRPAQDLAGMWSFTIDPQDRGEELEYFSPALDTTGWEKMPVPGVWNTRDSEHAGYEGAAWYRTVFVADRGVKGGLPRLYFDGVIFHGKVWLNGELLGDHSGGYTAWSVDATDAIIPGGDNLLVVRVDNRRSYVDVPPKLWQQEKLGWWPYGGIARVARLEWSPAVTINKLVVEAVPDLKGSGTLAVSGLVYNHGDKGREVELSAKTASGAKEIKAGRTTVTVPAGDCARFDLGRVSVEDVRLWSNHDPHLYKLSVYLDSDAGDETISEVYGFRSFEIKGTEIFLNGESYWMRGINRHEDDPETGLYQTDTRMDEDMALLKELHVNHMRPGHYPNDARWVDRCDNEGMTLIHEIPLYQAGSGIMKWIEAKIQKRRKGVPWHISEEYPTLKQMNDPELINNARQQIIEMIERDRNHPSIIMWSVGNENFTFLKRSQKMYEKLIATSRRFDDRPVTFALLSSPFYITPMLERTGHLADVIMLNEYYGWYFGKPEKVGKFLDRVHKKYPDKPIIVSEFGAGTVYGRHETPPGKFSEEYQAHVYETQYRHFLDDRPWVVGAMPWILADFRCPWFLEEHPIYMMNLKGVVDYERNKKMAFSTLSRIYGEMAEKEAEENGK